VTIYEHLQRRLTLLNVIKYGGALAAFALIWPYILPPKTWWFALISITGALIVVMVIDVLLKNGLLRCPRCDARVSQRSPGGRVTIPASCPKCGVDFSEQYDKS
jgi:hypothetical protein